jgi:hypothetical protein
MKTVSEKRRLRFPIHGLIGLLLIAVFWPVNWLLDGMRSHWGFFPLWLGFCLVVDALVLRRKGSSLLTRRPLAYVGLILSSVPLWWLFELINKRTQNWVYLSDGTLGPVTYFLLASLSFSTVVPAVFGAAELVGTFGWIRAIRRGPRIGPNRGVLVLFFFLGAVMLAATLAQPEYFYPCVWLSVFFLIEPINAGLGFRSLLSQTARGDWRFPIALATGALLCGCFWEMWNYFSYPKWTYHVPFVDFGRVFEMPILGYGGYIPFSFELFAMYHLIVGLMCKNRLQDYVQPIPE